MSTAPLPMSPMPEEAGDVLDREDVVDFGDGDEDEDEDERADQGGAGEVEERRKDGGSVGFRNGARGDATRPAGEEEEEDNEFGELQMAERPGVMRVDSAEGSLSIPDDSPSVQVCAILNSHR